MKTKPLFWPARWSLGNLPHGSASTRWVRQDGWPTFHGQVYVDRGFFRILCENWGDGSATRLRSSTLRLEGWRRSRRLCETWGREIPTSPCAITLATNGPSSPDCRCHSYARDPVLWGCSMEDRGGDDHQLSVVGCHFAVLGSRLPFRSCRFSVLGSQFAVLSW